MDSVMRIGELARRTGVTPALLRAWEQRYGLLRPERSSGGFRLYSADDEARVRRTTELIGDGLSAAEAARLAVEGTTAVPAPLGLGDDGASAVAGLVRALRTATEDFDPAAAHSVLDRLLGTVSVDYAVAEVLIPFLHELGERWAAGEVSVAQEHFASQLVRGRLLGLAGDWGVGNPSRAVLASLPGESHDIGLVLLGVLISRRGWHATFLGADTPLDTVASAVDRLAPRRVVLSTVDAGLLRKHGSEVADLASRVPVLVGGLGDDPAIVAVGAVPLPGGIPEAAAVLAGGRAVPGP